MTYSKKMTIVVTVAFTAIVAFASTGSTGKATRNAFPGQNGRIVFNDQNGALNLVNADGTGLVRLANTNVQDTFIGAAWSPDGKTIAYSKVASDPDIFTVAP